MLFSSPHYHKSNGPAERAVGIVESMVKKSKNCDLQELLMEYRNNPLTSMPFTPSELLFGRILKTKIPVSTNNLENNIDKSEVQNMLNQKLAIQKRNYDKTAKDLKKLSVGEKILFYKNHVWEKGIIGEIVNDRSYIVMDLTGNKYRRNRIFIKKTNLSFDMHFKNTPNIIYDFSITGLDNDCLIDGTITPNDNTKISHDPLLQNNIDLDEHIDDEIVDNNLNNTDLNQIENVNDLFEELETNVQNNKRIRKLENFHFI